MKKQDDKIQQLFDSYASELTPRNDLSSAARDEMVALNKQPKPSASARQNNGFVRHLGWLIPVSAVVLFIAVFSVFGPIFGLGDFLQCNHNAQTPPVTPAETVYTFADVKGRSVTLDDCDEALQVSRLLDEYDIINSRYYAFYTADGELRYIRAFLGVRDQDGVFTELELIAEVDGYVREDLKSIYDSLGGYSGLVSDSGYAANGEYVTQAYFAARNMHFYVVARNGQASSVARDLISTLLD